MYDDFEPMDVDNMVEPSSPGTLDHHEFTFDVGIGNFTGIEALASYILSNLDEDDIAFLDELGRALTDL